MTDRIDLDEVDTEPEETESAGNEGDWLWRDDESNVEPETSSAGSEADDRSAATRDPADAPAPHVPKTDSKRPAGIPVKGTGPTASQSSSDKPGGSGRSARPMGADDASGPHGGGADDMTMAITYNAVRKLARPDRVFAGAVWADWVGIVGDVPAHVIQKFQREHGIDADFFNGTGTEPGERLAEIDRNSMFYADRLVVVGCEGEDESIAEAADWEFVPLAQAAAKADWELSSPAESA